jgi:hypothetical protein
MDDRTSLSATDSLTGLRQKSRQKCLQTGTGKGFELELGWVRIDKGFTSDIKSALHRRA